jgi:hypothetical protein
MLVCLPSRQPSHTRRLAIWQQNLLTTRTFGKKHSVVFTDFGTLSLLIPYRLTGFGRLRCREDRFSRQNNPSLLPYSRPGGLPKNGPGKF